jgi:hypothetical protein
METTVQRVVTLGNGTQIPLGRYVAGIHDAIRHPDRTYRHGLCGWAPVTGREVRWEFRRGVHDRINRHLATRTDTRAALRFLKHLRCHERGCAWCGTRFVPQTVNDRWCNPECRQSYYF